ncbi:hypothetical protein [Gloeobacter kilaueensis]|uniref:EF-hand domain-containing protein n=1 Tax=Gloeobacter kilaueensis (strain ATCC BAA-2537 / CCAP 1431/1 / ULC 316 / JS1) TaxID=1183438 RepID=U5QM24_GLOK1|nr:hypothetical protein [Gloeobacter kilaueensis]AGY59918.1 hypothetical protein GKIL_3672 [Gloeobacter kilaueensis JS1]
MDQEKGKGHHAITQKATDQLFDGKSEIDGMDKETYYEKLDEGQEHADRIVGGDTWKPYWMAPDAQREHSMADPSKSGEQNLSDIRNFVAGGLESAKAAHDATTKFDGLDRDHDGFLSHDEVDQGVKSGTIDGRAASYLGQNQDSIEDLHDDESIDDLKGVSKADLQAQEMRELGAATHALEDSYSNAHMFRDTSDPSDPHAAVQGINVFNPLDEETGGAALAGAAAGAVAGLEFGPLGAVVGGVIGGLVAGGAEALLGEDAETHVKVFDEVPVDDQGQLERSSDQAAAQASAEMLKNYYDHRDDSEADADSAFTQNVDSYYQASPNGVEVYDDNDDPHWQQERDARLQEQEQEVAGYGADGGAGADPTSYAVPDDGGSCEPPVDTDSASYSYQDDSSYETSEGSSEEYTPPLDEQLYE